MTIHKHSPWSVLIFLSINSPLLRYTKFHKNVLISCPASAFLAIRYISANYIPFENTCAYWFLSKYHTRQSMVSMAHMPVRFFVWITLPTLYRLDMGITAEGVSLCVVLAILSLVCLINI